MQQDNREKILEILREYTDAENITEDSDILEDLELSSLEVFGMLSNLEDEFDITIPEKTVRKIITVGDLYREIEGCMI